MKVNTVDITIYSKNNCKYCKKVYNTLDKLKLIYKIKNMDTYPSLKEELLRIAPECTKVPQIFIDNEHIGGYSDLVKMIDRGDFGVLINKKSL